MTRLLGIILLLFTGVACSLHATPSPVVSRFSPRSPSANSVYKIVGEIPGIHTHVYEPELKRWDSYDPLMLGSFANYTHTPFQAFVSITGAAQKSFNSPALSRTLFGTGLTKDRHGGSCLSIQGSKVENRNPNAWLADYFYLPDTFNGIVHVTPTIANDIAIANAYIGLDALCRGLYLRIYAPLVRTKWCLNMREQIFPYEGQTVTGGRFSPDTIEPDNLFTSVTSFFNGTTPPVFTQHGVRGADLNAPYTIIRNPLNTHKIDAQKSPKQYTGISEIRMELGLDCWRRNNGHVGICFVGGIPVSEKMSNEYLFSPAIGNGNHAECGAGLNTHWLFWHNSSEKHQMRLCTDITLTHLFSSQQCRTFDLKNKPMSRYMLAAKHVLLTPPGGQNVITGSSRFFEPTFDCTEDDDERPRYTEGFTSLTGERFLAQFQFADEFTPVANLTTRKVQVRIDAQLDATLWLNYTTPHTTVDLGYNLWVRTRDRIRPLCKQTQSPLANEYWALHGQAQLFGYFTGTIEAGGTNFGNKKAGSKAIAIPASESTATLSGGADPFTPMNEQDTNIMIDNPFVGSARTVGPPEPNPDTPLVNFAHRTLSVSGSEISAKLAEDSIHISIEPRFITEDSIDFNPRVKALSHTLFIAFGYTTDHPQIAPYIGLGGSIEFGDTDTLPCLADMTSSVSCAPSQWSMWAKIGVSFH